MLICSTLIVASHSLTYKTGCSKRQINRERIGIAAKRRKKHKNKPKQKAEEEASRARYLDLLGKREDATWDQVTELIQKKQPKAYDQAIRLLIDLRDLAGRQHLEGAFKSKIEKLRETYRAKNSLLDRLTRAGL